MRVVSKIGLHLVNTRNELYLLNRSIPRVKLNPSNPDTFNLLCYGDVRNMMPAD